MSEEALGTVVGIVVGIAALVGGAVAASTLAKESGVFNAKPVPASTCACAAPQRSEGEASR